MVQVFEKYDGKSEGETTEEDEKVSKKEEDDVTAMEGADAIDAKELVKSMQMNIVP